jgi:hypothetical protein
VGDDVRTRRAGSDRDRRSFRRVQEAIGGYFPLEVAEEAEAIANAQQDPGLELRLRRRGEVTAERNAQTECALEASL